MEHLTVAERHDVPALALAQLNRESEQGRPSLRRFADTSQVKKESDVAMILWREKRDFGGWDYQLRVEKNRNGQTGSIRLYCDEQTMYFSEEAGVRKGENRAQRDQRYL